MNQKNRRQKKTATGKKCNFLSFPRKRESRIMKKKKSIKNSKKKVAKFLESIKKDYKILRVPDIEIPEDSSELIKINL